MFYISFAISNFILYSFFLSPRSVNQQPSSLSSKIYFLLIALIFIGIQLTGFFTLKNDNLYNIHNRTRQGLDLVSVGQHFKKNDTSQPNPSSVKLHSVADLELFILNNTELQLFYDRYGDLFIMAIQELQAWKEAGQYILGRNVVESLSFYISAVTLSMYFYRRRLKYKSLKKWLKLMIAGCFMIELELTVETFPTEALIDQFIPNLTTFERITLLKILFIWMMNTVIAYYTYVKDSKMARIGAVFETLHTQDQKFMKSNSKRTTKGRLEFSKIEVNTILEELENSTKRITKCVESGREAKRLVIETDRILIGIVIFFVIFDVAYTLPMLQEYIIGRFRLSSTGK